MPGYKETLNFRRTANSGWVRGKLNFQPHRSGFKPLPTVIGALCILSELSLLLWKVGQ